MTTSELLVALKKNLTVELTTERSFYDHYIKVSIKFDDIEIAKDLLNIEDLE